jgi:transcription factor 1
VVRWHRGPLGAALIFIVTDDIINYIGPSLEKHKGCDILDINPGACLWSQKLHDFLQPRSHILLEPTPEPFRDFLNPLLNAPDSRYKLVTKDPVTLSSYREMVDEGMFPHQTRVDQADPRSQERNNTLFVTGSLAWDPRLPGMGFDSMSKQVVHHFAQAAWTNDIFHAFGPVCMLLWVQHDDFNAMLAQAIYGMQKSNRILEMAQDITMVVAAERKGRVTGRGSISREPQYEMESVVKALQAARSNDIVIPQHRRDYAHALAADIEATSEGTGISRSLPFQTYLHNQHLAGVIPNGLSPVALIDNAELEIRLRRDHPDLHLEAFMEPGPKGGTKKPRYGNHPAADDISNSRLSAHWP